MDLPKTQEELDALIAERLASEVEGLKKNQQDVLREKKALADRLKTFDGLDPDEAKTWREKISELEAQSKAQAAGITSEALAKLRAEAIAESEKKYGPVASERDALKAEVRSLKLDSNVKALMAKAGARAERIDALFKLSADRFDLTNDGKPMVKDATKEVDKYIVEDLLKEYPEFFQGSGSSGGGASKSTGGAGGTPKVIAPSELMANLDAVAKGQITVQA